MTSSLDGIGRDTINAVLLDVGGVFVLPDPVPVRAALSTAGLNPPADDEAYRRAHYAGAAAYDESADRPESWAAYHVGYAAGLGYYGEACDRAIEHLLQVWSMPRLWSWRQDEEVAALVRLSLLGLDLGIVSNSDGTVEHRLLELAICQVGAGDHVEMRVIVDSAVVGREKPAPETFAPALEALGVRPERVLFVGDTLRNDVAGARAVGMVPLLVDPYDHHRDTDHLRVSSLHELADALSR